MPDLTTTFKFALEVDNVTVGFFRKCAGIESETEIIEFKEATEQGRMVIRKVPGAMKWSDITLDRRIGAGSFRPRPSVDGGLLLVDRRTDPLIDVERRDAYQQWAAGVFQGRGRGLSDVLIRRGVPATLAGTVEAGDKELLIEPLGLRFGADDLQLR